MPKVLRSIFASGFAFFAYRLVNKITPCDICQVLLLDLSSRRPPSKEVSGYNFCFLTAEQIREFSEISVNDINASMAEIVSKPEIRCFAALNDGNLAGYIWFASGRVAAEHNTGGTRFAGIGLELPTHVVYLFKAFVVPTHRGNSLNHWLINKAADELEAEKVTHVVTTTDWKNEGFQKSAAKAGFSKCGHTAEWVVGKYHHYHIPKLEISDVAFLPGT